jgi:hypothetical protein
MIRLYERKQINGELWNKCVEQAFHSSVTGYTWYLDTACENWSALILNNYKAVLPLPIKSKFTIDYLLQPLFIKSLNIYSDNKPSVSLINAFLDAIPSSVKLIDFNLNLPDMIYHVGFEIIERPAQLLDINVPYEILEKNYKGNVHRNLQKAKENNLTIVDNVSVEQVVELFKSNVGHKITHLKTNDYNVLKKIMQQALFNQCGFSIGVTDKDKHLVAAAFLMQSTTSIYCFNESSNQAGKHSGAMFFLRDEIIKRYAKSKQQFDFEGSSLKGVADFNKQFGAKDCVYLQIKRNTLPYLVRKWINK